MKLKSFAYMTLFIMSFALYSCGDEEVGGNGSASQLQTPGDEVKGAVGCTEDQKNDIEDIPGMGNIVSTILGEDGTYIYSDASGNTCTLNKDGDILMEGKDSSTVQRDHTVTESKSAQATELTGKYMSAVDEVCDISDPSIYEASLKDILQQFPQARDLIEVSSNVTPGSEQNHYEYDYVSISFQNEICIYETTKMQEIETVTYNTVETDYTAHDGYFEIDYGQPMHLKVEGGVVRLFIIYKDSQYNYETGEWEEYDCEKPYDIHGEQPMQANYHSVEKTDVRRSYEDKCSPSHSVYYNYKILDNGNVRLTNKDKYILLEKENRRFYEYRDADLKFELITPGNESDNDYYDTGSNDDVDCPINFTGNNQNYPTR